MTSARRRRTRSKKYIWKNIPRSVSLGDIVAQKERNLKAATRKRTANADKRRKERARKCCLKNGLIKPQQKAKKPTRSTNKKLRNLHKAHKRLRKAHKGCIEHQKSIAKHREGTVKRRESNKESQITERHFEDCIVCQAVRRE